MRSTGPGCHFVRGVGQVPVPGPRINLESSAGCSMPGYSRSTMRTDPAVPKMSSRAYASCIARHDKIIDLVVFGAEKIGYSIRHEPAIPTPAGVQRLDLVLVRNSDLTILDVTIVADNADLEKTYNYKCVYYDVQAIKEWAQLCFEPRNIAFETLAMNWRGLLATRSAGYYEGLD
ncbi:unnamed protein product [Porites evermanni]|uniref:Uncharacterized protein n=1 Tax=Porites evermanni TaxID=104178 RepID=A0ABN8M4M9_9CNID|nr:unnamed protein product [Porites evermanni]